MRCWPMPYVYEIVHACAVCLSALCKCLRVMYLQCTLTNQPFLGTLETLL